MQTGSALSLSLLYTRGLARSRLTEAFLLVLEIFAWILHLPFWKVAFLSDTHVKCWWNVKCFPCVCVWICVGSVTVSVRMWHCVLSWWRYSNAHPEQPIRCYDVTILYIGRNKVDKWQIFGMNRINTCIYSRTVIMSLCLFSLRVEIYFLFKQEALWRSVSAGFSALGP